MEKHDMLISAAYLQSQLDDENLRIVDCRFNLMQPHSGRRSYLEAHIPGAVYADLDKDLAAPIRADSGRHPLPEAGQLARTFGRLGIGNDMQVVAYDDAGGALAARAWWLLRWMGHDHVAVLDGGMARWCELDFGLENGDVAVETQVFTAQPREELVLETVDLLAAGDSVESLGLVDARDTDRYRGRSEPIDSVAGHVPGALNLPYGENLNSDGTWKKPQELHELWSGVLGSRLEKPFSVMCGSGVTACHLVLSSLLAGLREPRVYVGSWSEWIRDPDRPVETGPGTGSKFT